MYGFALIAILIITGGVIAYIGDRIGMSIGRKRLSLFGLRPKYTSIVITIITGLLIAGATIAVLVIVSADVRTALFRMKEIKLELAETKTTLAEIQEEYRIVSAQIEAKANEYAELVDKYGVLTTQYDTLTDEYQELMTEYTELHNSYSELSSDYRSLSDDYAMLDKRFVDLSNRYEGLSTEYDTLLIKYNSLSSDYTMLSTKYVELKDDYDSLTAELAKTVEERDKINSDLVVTRTNLTKTTEELRSAEEALISVQLAKEELSATVEELKEEKTKLENAFLSLWTGLEGMLGGDVVFRSGEIILATVIECDRPMNEIEEDMLRFLIDANDLALERGAQIEGDQENAIWFDAEDLDTVYKELSSRIKGKAVVRLISATNTILGDAVWAYFQVLPDDLVFEEGEVIVQRKIDNNQKSGTVQYDLFAMLAEANAVAIERGMITDAQGTVGRVVSMQDFQTAIAQITSSDVPVTVSVVVIADTYRAEGPLNVRFAVVGTESIETLNN
jgi:uncharacterized protein (DUF3084 family)